MMAESEGDWYYADGERQCGPVKLDELRGLIRAHRVGPSDLVWTEGWDQWEQVKKVNKLADLLAEPEVLFRPSRAPEKESIRRAIPFELGPGPASKSAAARASSSVPGLLPGQEPESEPAVLALAPKHAPDAHFLDSILTSWRSGGGLGSRLERLPTWLTEVGRYSLSVAMAVSGLMAVILAIKTNRPSMLFEGIVAVATMVVLQFCGVKLALAMPRLIRSYPSRLSSTVFPDCLALLLGLGGFLALDEFLAAWLQLETMDLLIVGAGTVLLCELSAWSLLNPTALEVVIDPDQSASQEALSLLSLLLKMPLWLSPITFGIGTCLGAGWLLFCFLTMFRGEEALQETLSNAPHAAGFTLGAAAVPVVGFVYSICYSLLIDVLRAILASTEKLDHRAGREPRD